jgi:4-amino-4-deoxy-L-arabinose transferase-like glycosyltransferase
MKIKYLLIIFWLLISFFVRFIGLEKSPISLNFDEAGLGYNAYSLLLTQKDEFGNKYPLALRSFNDYKPALYSYLSIPFVKVLGLNQTSARIVSALFGTLSLLFFFLIFKQITHSSFLTSLLVSVFISFLPWRLHYSRVAFESNLSMCFFTIMFWSLINLSKSKIHYLGTIFFALLSIYSYHGARLAVPILLLLLFSDPLSTGTLKNILQKPAKFLIKLWPLFVVAIFSIPIFVSNNSISIFRRFDQTNVFSRFYPYTPQELITNNTHPWLNLTNSPLYYITGIISGHILSYLSPRNLAISIYHWVNKSPQGISGTGMLGWLAAIFIIFGLWQWLKKVNINRNYRYLFYWLLAAVSPVAVTFEWFHPLRSLNGYPALEIICGLGIIAVFKLFKTKIYKIIWSILLTGLFLVSFVYNLNNELNYAIYDTNGEFQPGGYKEGAALLNNLKDKYQTIYLDSPHAQSYVMFLFYLKYPPQNVQKYADSRPPMGTEGFLNFNFDNFVYKKYNWLEDRTKHNFVYWTSAEVLENEISDTPGAKLYKIYDPLGRWVTSIITKE